LPRTPSRIEQRNQLKMKRTMGLVLETHQGRISRKIEGQIKWNYEAHEIPSPNEDQPQDPY
jgi:hypothetical protein